MFGTGFNKIMFVIWMLELEFCKKLYLLLKHVKGTFLGNRLDKQSERASRLFFTQSFELCLECETEFWGLFWSTFFKSKVTRNYMYV